jgi:diguanylate cyclase (GGDEF)-like protein
MRGKGLYIAAVTLLLIVGFIITSFTSYYVAHRALTAQIAEEALPLTSDNIYSEIQRDLLTPILISSLMANDTFVHDWISTGEADELRIRSYLAEIQRRYHTITAFLVSDSSLNYYHPSGVLKRVSPGDEADAWYFSARTGSEPYQINIDSDTADRSRINIFINHQVRDGQGQLLGVAGVGLSLSAVTGLIENYQRRYGRTIYFVDRNGDVTLHGSGFEDASSLRDRPGLARHATHILATPSSSFSYADASGEEIHLNSRLVPEFGWYLLVEQPQAKGEQGLRTSLLFNLLLSLAITAAVMLIAYFTLRNYQRRLEQMATTDKLTGSASRQVFDLIFEHVEKTARRRSRPMALLNLDIDHFKSINDNYGHQCGDEVIREVAHRIRSSVREADTVCRWGGEEFLVLLDDCDLAKARARADAICQAVRARPVIHAGRSIPVSVSVGVAQYTGGEGLESLLRRSDEALYLAKNGGRDRVVSV